MGSSLLAMQGNLYERRKLLPMWWAFCIQNMKKYYIASVIILIILGYVGYNFSKNVTYSNGESFDNTFYKNSQPTQAPVIDPLNAQANSIGGKTYPVQESNFWGYDLYTSKVDSTGNIDIGSEQKQNIVKLLNALGYPKKLTTKLIIASLDPTIVKENDTLQIPWTGYPVKFSSATRMENSGLFTQIDGKEGAIIFINNTANFNTETLTHELGHYIGTQMTEDEWRKFYKLRHIASGTPRLGSSWESSPTEDFAEVYKATYNQSPLEVSRVTHRQSGSNEWDIKTIYGILVPSQTNLIIDDKCYELEQELVSKYVLAHSPVNNGMPYFDFSANAEQNNKARDVVQSSSELQKCRRDNNGISKYTGGYIYTSQLDEQTKEFVRSLITRLVK